MKDPFMSHNVLLVLNSEGKQGDGEVKAYPSFFY